MISGSGTLFTNDNYTVFVNSGYKSVHSSIIQKHILEKDYVVYLGKELVDPDWIKQHIHNDYIGVFCSPPSTVPFYFKDRNDAFIFKLKYGICT